MDILLKIQRAEKHIGELHGVLGAFIKSKPYVISTESNPQSGKFLCEVKEAKEIPAEVALIAGDVLQNLRTALDYLAHALIQANGGTVTKYTSFPIFDDPTKYQAGFIGKVEGMRQEPIDIISAIKPYKGGDNVLWRLHRLNNIDKHRLLFTIGTALRGFVKGSPGGEDEALLPMKVGYKFTVDIRDPKIHKDVNLSFDITLNEPGVCEGEPIILVLRSSMQRVIGVLRKFESWL
ncbi:MAG TPA: hypothetical protein VNW97_05555 [Candidatus Saccharimonadales bacterium]|jgi:hypothetical protein|nr:hypothetical protein [Candidatus Saccharimonadales bacterium]